MAALQANATGIATAVKRHGKGIVRVRPRSSASKKRDVNSYAPYGLTSCYW